jgi:outer membrane protein assembly factor BamC
MRLLKAARGVVCVVLGATMAACNMMPSLDTKIDYKSASQLPPLEIPPDLTRPTADDRYVVPMTGAQGSTTYSEYTRDRGKGPAAGETMVLPQTQDARIERDGSQRWLVVKGVPDQVWPVVKGFWQEVGFIVNLEVPEAGIMETDWAENRAKIDAGTIRNILGKLLDSVYSTAERDKFRTRLERGSQAGTTEVYISHRGMQEVFVDTARREETMWQPRPPDPNLEVEMLGRLMTRFGVEQSRVKAQIATRGAPVQERASLARAPDGSRTLSLDEQFDRAWRRVGLALDRVGFTVEDRDRSKGLYFVRYIDPKIDTASSDAKKGFFGRLFSFGGGSSDKSKQEQYRIEVKDAARGCEIQVFNKDGVKENSDTSARILTLLYEQLK